MLTHSPTRCSLVSAMQACAAQWSGAAIPLRGPFSLDPPIGVAGSSRACDGYAPLLRGERDLSDFGLRNPCLGFFVVDRFGVFDARACGLADCSDHASSAFRLGELIGPGN